MLVIPFDYEYIWPNLSKALRQPPFHLRNKNTITLLTILLLPKWYTESATSIKEKHGSIWPSHNVRPNLFLHPSSNRHCSIHSESSKQPLADWGEAAYDFARINHFNSSWTYIKETLKIARSKDNTVRTITHIASIFVNPNWIWKNLTNVQLITVQEKWNKKIGESLGMFDQSALGLEKKGPREEEV